MHFINHIEFLLQNYREYSYKIEASLDDRTYEVIVDHSQYSCRSWQDLFFPSTVVRYIRLSGANIEVIRFKAMYQRKIDDLLNGFVNPSWNVATYATVIEGAGGNNMLHSKMEEFTCQIGSGAIIVHLNQPYWINSVGFRLGHQRCRSNKYSFCIETSTNKENWTMAVDKEEFITAPNKVSSENLEKKGEFN